jgi:protein-tyrosine kinase
VSEELFDVLPGEGKTHTAINLASTFAKKFKHTALLVDCDLKKQNIHKVLGFENNKGLVDYILGECAITDLIVWPGIEKLTIASGGKTIDESSEILGSPRMKGLVENIKKRYRERYVFFDVPPILAGADAMTFANLVDNILIVVQADKTSMMDVKKALQMMPQEKIIGLVLNRTSAEKSSYYTACGMCSRSRISFFY